jgi:uncharacterized repeat protein (TIGR01451 family)
LDSLDKNWNNPWRDKTFPGGAIIQAHGFYLIGLKGFPEPSSDWQVYNSTQLADSGSVGIFPWDPDTKTAEEAKAGRIDAVGWGSVTYVYETATASTPSSGESIERKSLNGGYGPCKDTNNNSIDFFVQGTPTPKNSTSQEMDPPCTCGDICVNTTGWWRDGGAFNASNTPIQAAVDNATAGETICVKAGSYNENVDIATSHLTLRGEGADVVTVTVPFSEDHIFEVTADWVNISGFTATGTTSYAYAGIYLYGVDHCNISENAASNYGWGIWLSYSSSNTLTSNTANSNSGDGIWLSYSSSNTLTSNTANSNGDDGISVCDSSSNTLTSNTANLNSGDGICLHESSSNTLTSNTANSNSMNGIWLYDSINNTLTSNTANSNSGDGICLGYTSGGNLIYNNYFNNTNNARNVCYQNQWNITKTSGTNIIGGPYLGGNYWSDYAGVDNDGDGLGDTLLPYNSSGNIQTGGDWHPLVQGGFGPPDITSFAPPSPVNDTVCYWRTFNVMVNQTVNVSWYLNNSFLFKNESVREANYTLHAEFVGDNNVSAKVENANGTDMQTWVWNVTAAPAPAAPNITSFAPPSPVNDTVCTWRMFNVTVNQTVDVSWYLNESFLFTNDSVTEANYTLHAQFVGDNNVSAVATNANGTDMQTWIWNVTAAPLPVLEINKTDNLDPVSPGGILNYSIRVNNTGNTTATNVIVTETYDENVTFVGAVPAPSLDNDTWVFATLNVSKTKWVNISVSVNSSVLSGTVLHNIVNVTCDEGVTDSDTEDTTVFVTPVPVLEINKTDVPDPVSPGGILNYSISVNNTGNATATNVC